MEGFPSGQREQTVNLPAKPTEVRTLPPPPSLYSGGRLLSGIEDGKSFYYISGSSSVARASAFQAEGRGFESRFPLQFVWQKALSFLHGSATDSAKAKIDRGAGCRCGEKAVSLEERITGPRSSVGRAHPW